MNETCASRARLRSLMRFLINAQEHIGTRVAPATSCYFGTANPASTSPRSAGPLARAWRVSHIKDSPPLRSNATSSNEARKGKSGFSDSVAQDFILPGRLIGATCDVLQWDSWKGHLAESQIRIAAHANSRLSSPPPPRPPSLARLSYPRGSPR